MTSPNQSRKNTFERLQEWYLGQCNDDWEHSFGVKIDTLDNPGWIMTVDLAETEWTGTARSLIRIENDELDWYQHEVSNNQFVGCCGPLNLEVIVNAFLEFVESKGC